MNEKTVRLWTLLGELEEPFVEYEASRPKYRWYAVAAVACAAVITLCAVGLFGGSAVRPSDTPTCTVTTTSAQPTDKTEAKVIFHSPMACYAEGPAIGEVFVEYPLELLKQSIAENGRVLLKISLRDENGPVLHSEAVYRELDRLKSLGYELYIYEEDGVDYWGAPRPVTHICTYVTDTQQIERFPAGDRFAYSISPYYFSVPIEEYTRY